MPLVILCHDRGKVRQVEMKNERQDETTPAKPNQKPISTRPHWLALATRRSGRRVGDQTLPPQSPLHCGIRGEKRKPIFAIRKNQARGVSRAKRHGPDAVFPAHQTEPNAKFRPNVWAA